MLDKDRSCSSNSTKLYKHLDRLSMLQRGKVIPIMVHTMPTHRCQMNCVFCCFKNRKDKQLDMPFEVYREGVRNFRALGTKSVELTGGGDPSLYPWINEALLFLKADLGMNIGIITNAVDSQRVDYWKLCDWVRVSFNVFDYYESVNIGPIRDSRAFVSGCYIWNEKSDMKIFEKVVRFANEEKIVCRVAPDCIKTGEEIEKSLEELRIIFKELRNNEYVFLSDFNISTTRQDFDCRMHMIKPAFYTDGYIYSCPSIELAYENNRRINESARICRYDEVLDFYLGKEVMKPKERSCSYCKYTKQQEILKEVLTETMFNEYA